MEEYVVNKHTQLSTGFNKIHKIDCVKKPNEENTINLGKCICIIDAENRAKNYFQKVNGCKYCCKEIYYKN